MSASPGDGGLAAAPSDGTGLMADWVEGDPGYDTGPETDQAPGTEDRADPEGEPDLVHRQLLDDLAAAREEMALQAASAREARSVISANEARFIAVLDGLSAERNALLASLRAAESRSAAAEERAEAAAVELAEVEQRSAALLARTQALEAELAALAATRTMRWSKVPREIYRIHVRGEPRSGGDTH